MESKGTSWSLLEDATADLMLPGEKSMFISDRAVFIYPAITALEAGLTFPRDVTKRESTVPLLWAVTVINTFVQYTGSNFWLGIVDMFHADCLYDLLSVFEPKSGKKVTD